MPAFLTEPGDQQARRLVLRPIQPVGLDGRAHRSVTGEGLGQRDQEWEFADPWATDEGSAAALAVTRRVGDWVMLLRIWVSDGAPAETIRLLVDQLVAVLRRTDASMVCSLVEDAAVREELLAVGFRPLPYELEAAHPRIPADRGRIVLQL
ncbi:hypothetical protein OG558_15520 [Kribbella sp. NBC_01510]|uniref:hypothetical protein n=1 Tax=Kribbella sp. NBC_01510 TaxID=2903581 RepID=UPI003866FF59